MRGRTMHRFLWLAALAVLVQACAVGPTRIDVDQELQSQLRRVDTWQAQGKLGLRLEGDAHSANFDWHNQSDNFTLRLSGPFGQGTTWLRRQNRLVALERPNEPVTTANSAEQLMFEHLGWQVPVSNLRYWIKGIAAPGQRTTHIQRNEDGTLAELHQQGWTITYGRYSVHNGWALPAKLIARRDDLQLTVIVKSWEMEAPAARAALSH